MLEGDGELNGERATLTVPGATLNGLDRHSPALSHSDMILVTKTLASSSSAPVRLASVHVPSELVTVAGLPCLTVAAQLQATSLNLSAPGSGLGSCKTQYRPEFLHQSFDKPRQVRTRSAGSPSDALRFRSRAALRVHAQFP